MTSMQFHYIPEKFQNAEQMWFWFITARNVRNDIGRYKDKPENRKICELVDVETLVTKLYLAGKLTDEQLVVMKEYGDRRRTPHQYIWHENHDAAVWRDAMNTLNTAAMDKGWIE